MFNVLSLNKTGIKANQTKMDGVANDLANVTTYGYKRKEISFEALRLREIGRDVLKSDRAQDMALSMGARAGVSKNTFNQGTMTPSSMKFNMAINGDGFFGVRDGNGNLLLTRNGNFHQNADGSVTDANGNPLEMVTYQPFERWTGDISISQNGEITTMEGDQRIALGQVVLYSVSNPDDLISMGENNYMFRNGAGELYNSLEGGDFGQINQYYLEESNVEMTRSMVDMITTQRAYSMNGKALQTTDEILTMINNIKR